MTRAMHTTSDYPLILGDTMNRVLRRAYNAAPAGIMQVARQSTARDFRAKHALMFGAGPQLEEVKEGGEFKHGTIEEAGESYSLSTFGRIFSYSRQAQVNDDSWAPTQAPARLGAAARAFEAKKLVERATTNPNMSDGVAIFHADHTNLTTGATALDLAALAAARLAMRRRTGLASELIDVTPKFVIVPPELETTGEQVLATIAATKTADANPFQTSR